MKIAIIYASSYSKLNGMSASSRRVRDIARGLAFAGATVSLLIPNRLNPDLSLQEKDVFNIEPIYGFKQAKFFDRLLFYKKSSDYINNNFYNFVIYYSPTIEAILSIFLLKKNIKRILEVSDFVSEGKVWQGTMKGFLFKLGEKYLPKFCHASISISKKISHFNKFQNKNINDIILPVLVDTERFTKNPEHSDLRELLNIPKETLIIGYSGGTYIEYGLDILIEAFSALNINIDVRLIIAGKLVKEDKKYTDLAQLVDDYKIFSKVHLLGWVNDDMVMKLLNSSDVLVVPHLDLPLNNSGLPTKLAEYAIMGKSILSTNLGDINKYFKHRSSIYLIKGSSVEEMKNGLTELLTDAEMRKTLELNAKIIAEENFDYKVQGLQLYKHIKSLSVDV